jgi:hypothetical protein
MAVNADLPLNTFKTLTHDITTTETIVYTCPPGVTTVVLLSQVSNIHASNTFFVSAYISRYISFETYSTTYLVKNAPIPTKDAGTLLTGKLILQENDRLVVFGNASNTAQLVVSYLETANA